MDFGYRRGGLVLATAACILFIWAHAVAQSGALQPVFGAEAKPLIYDVSTIKPNNTGSGSVRISINDETFYATNVSVKMMLQNAFDIRQELISQLPKWAESNRYDIVGKISDADAETIKSLNREKRQQMLMQLLVDRFHVKSHIEIKELPTFDLVVAKGGVKFQEMSKDAPNDKQGSMNINNTTMTAYGIPMESLTKSLEGRVDRNVIDKTGLMGKYDINLKWRREEDGPTAGVTDDTVPGLFTALQEQLGLKLESSKGPTPTLVIDHIELPTEN
jgi:bla regulator protein blaR1